ncbi:hypothetical protein Q0Z83_032760 [Actinoplanes sichuanensis]|uniref:PH domain-containing protein n=1 Tax=Actinoplanes sichuanensis TaxID=512349 RepID=A0ABW4A6T8_9ACTN|nr:hypothetical protein [Actinoplanes sichuanensis]BEL05085.1 hypothetical protein Q0Z83_032760 [Actinoplanes sichuanensis]
MDTDETTPIPAKVTALATAHRLGAPVGHRATGDPARAALIALLLSVVSFAAAFALFSLFLIALAVPALVLAVGALGWAIVFPFWGSAAVYAYEHGLVHVRNGRARAALWLEMERMELHVIRNGNLMAGTTSAYLLKPSGQAPMRVRPRLSEQPDGTSQDPFGTLLTRLVADAGRPVVQTLIGRR